MRLDFKTLTGRFSSSVSGASAVEFAFVSVPLIALLLFSLQAVILYFADAALQTYADEVARGLLTGSTQKSALTSAVFRAQACTKLPSLFSCDRLWVDVSAYANFTNLATVPPALAVGASGTVATPWTYAPGSQGNVVVIRMAYMWPVVAMPMGDLSNLTSNIHQLVANSVLRTEGYQ